MHASKQETTLTQVLAHLQALLSDLLAQLENALDQRLGTRWAARDIDIDRNNGIRALNGIVTIVELAARIGALAHADYPLWLRHLLPQLTEPGRHFDVERAGDDHQIGLARTGTEDLRAKTRQVILRR